MRAMTDLVPVRASSRFARLFDDAAANIIEPTMINAPEPTVFHAAITQIGSAMRTMQSQQPRMTLIVTKQHQVFTENGDLQRRSLWRQFLGQRNRLPVTPQEFARGSLW